MECTAELTHALMTIRKEVIEDMIEDGYFIRQPVIYSNSHFASLSVSQPKNFSDK